MRTSIPLQAGPFGRLLAVTVLLPVGLLAGCARDPLTEPRMGRSSALEAAGLQRPATASRARSAASGRVIAQLRENASGQEVAGSYGASLLSWLPELRLGLFAPAADSTEQEFLQALRVDSRVEFAEPDLLLMSAESRQASMAFDEGFHRWSEVEDQDAFVRVGTPTAHGLTEGGPILVAVLDTGIDLDHPALVDRVALPGVEPGVTGAAGDDRAEAVDSNEDGIVDGAFGHGTHVAGIVAALAPRAQLLSVRVLDSDGVGYAFAVARGVVAAVNRGARVLNLSLGMPVPSLAVSAAVDHALARGSLVVAPAGNAAAERIEFPASLPAVVAVAATGPDDRKAPFSNHGTEVDLAAPGVGVLSTYPDGSFARWSGTSMSAPFVAGLAGLLWTANGAPSALGAERIVAWIRTGARPLDAIDPEHADGLGAGRMDAAAAVKLALGGSSGGDDRAIPLSSGP